MNCYYCGKENVLYKLKNGNGCCEKSYNACPVNKEKMSKSKKESYKWTINANQIKTLCCFCNKEIAITGIKKHEKHCFNNPKNIKFCVQCGKQLSQKQLQYKNETCSCSCSNTYYKELRNKPEKYRNSRTICFHNYEKRCVICGEENIVAVHHYDEDHNNNNVDNLIPLCPTHHCYVHSRFYYLIEDKIEQYRNNIGC